MSRTSPGASGTDAYLQLMRPKPTGRLIVRFDPGLDMARRTEIIERAAGANLAALGRPSAADMAADTASPHAILARHGFAAVAEPAGARGSSMMQQLAADAAVRSVRPEFFLFASDSFADTDTATWGLAATGALDSPYTGKGIKVAILDTGLDREHPDFAGRTVVGRSFVPDEDWDDVQGHGTHCAGTAVGSLPANGGPRYGVAPAAELFVGKVLNNRGAGREGDIIAGMLWAVEQGCHVVSMSLGRTVRAGEIPTPAYEAVAEEALAGGCLIVAAAGNDSTRQYGFVAPGVGVISSVPVPKLYDKFSGTSMACPHLAGIAALWAESDPALRGRALWDKLVANAERLDGGAADVGAGLARAPVAADAPTS